MKDMIQHVRSATPRHFAVLHGRESAAGKLSHERVMFADVEITGENRRTARSGQVLPSTKGTL